MLLLLRDTIFKHPHPKNKDRRRPKNKDRLTLSETLEVDVVIRKTPIVNF
jgi:hypothetical protein